MVRRVLVLLLPLLLAGCAGTGHHGGGTGLDTGDIAPGSEATLTFADAGSVPIHCHPHPFMTQDVTVQEGGVATAHVHVFDGNATDEYRFEPQNLTVAPGAVVTYHNHGALVHTATEKTAGMDH